jgi:hypothetical protein
MVDGLIELPVILPQYRHAGTPTGLFAQEISAVTLE